MKLLFGEFLAEKRKERNWSLRALAAAMEISPPYLSDIEKGRRNPPDLAALEGIAKILQLSPEERNILLDYAGLDRKQLPPDIPEYIIDRPEAISAMRKARELNKEDEFWKKVIKNLEEE